MQLPQYLVKLTIRLKESQVFPIFCSLFLILGLKILKLFSMFFFMSVAKSSSFFLLTHSSSLSKLRHTSVCHHYYLCSRIQIIVVSGTRMWLYWLWVCHEQFMSNKWLEGYTVCTNSRLQGQCKMFVCENQIFSPQPILTQS